MDLIHAVNRLLLKNHVRRHEVVLLQCFQLSPGVFWEKQGDGARGHGSVPCKGAGPSASIRAFSFSAVRPGGSAPNR